MAVEQSNNNDVGIMLGTSLATTKDKVLDPFAGLTGLVSGDEIESETRLKIAIVGEPKSGKSWMAATAPGPILIYDFDGRSQSLRDKKGLKIKTLIDMDQSNPTTMKAVESDLSTLKYNFKKGLPIPTTFVFDSMTYMKKALENELMQQAGSKYYREIKTTALKSIRIPEGWDVINSVKGYMEYIIAEFSALGNVICVFHSRDQKDKATSTKVETKYTGKLTIDPQYLESVLSLFNEVYFIEVTNDSKYKVTCKPTRDCRASTTLEIDAIELPDINMLIEKHRSRIKAAKSK